MSQKPADLLHSYGLNNVFYLILKLFIDLKDIKYYRDILMGFF